jgi:DNA-binding NtrC family response regulator
MYPTKILLVDDEDAFLGAMTRRLEKRGLKVLTAISGQDSLKVLNDNSDIDVVILDVRMPGMDGIATLKEIKRLFAVVEVIMLTAHGTMESAIEGMKQGAFDYLMKPCEMDELIPKVEEARNKRRLHQQKILDAMGKHIAQNRGR